MSILLKICLPDNKLPEIRSDKVILPIQEGTLTIIDDRAPSLQLLKEGVLQLLDNRNHVTKTWYINGGFADIAENKCAVSTEQILDLDSIKINEIDENKTNNVFYKKAYQYLKTFGQPHDI